MHFIYKMYAHSYRITLDNPTYPRSAKKIQFYTHLNLLSIHTPCDRSSIFSRGSNIFFNLRKVRRRKQFSRAGTAPVGLSPTRKGNSGIHRGPGKSRIRFLGSRTITAVGRTINCLNGKKPERDPHTLCDSRYPPRLAVSRWLLMWKVTGPKQIGKCLNIVGVVYPIWIW